MFQDVYFYDSVVIKVIKIFNRKLIKYVILCHHRVDKGVYQVVGSN